MCVTQCFGSSTEVSFQNQNKFFLSLYAKYFYISWRPHQKGVGQVKVHFHAILRSPNMAQQKLIPFFWHLQSWNWSVTPKSTFEFFFNCDFCQFWRKMAQKSISQEVWRLILESIIGKVLLQRYEKKSYDSFSDFFVFWELWHFVAFSFFMPEPEARGIKGSIF